MIRFHAERCSMIAVIAQLVEHFLGKEEVTSSNLVNSSKNLHAVCRDCVLFWLYRKIASTQWDSEFLCDLSKKLTTHLSVQALCGIAFILSGKLQKKHCLFEKDVL